MVNFPKQPEIFHLSYVGEGPMCGPKLPLPFNYNLMI